MGHTRAHSLQVVLQALLTWTALKPAGSGCCLGATQREMVPMGQKLHQVRGAYMNERTTPRGVTSAFVFNRIFDCGSFEDQKQSVSNAFQYVVLHPVAPSSSDNIAAVYVDAATKLQLISEIINNVIRFYAYLIEKSEKSVGTGG